MQTLVSDRGQCFNSELVRALSALFNVKRAMTSAYHPATNSSAERMNQFINKSLRTYVCEDQSDWPAFIPGIMMAYRLTPATRSTEFSPYFLLFGKHMRTPFEAEIEAQVPNLPQNYRADMQTFVESAKMTRDIAKENLERHQQYNKQYFDKRTSNPQYDIGDLVWLHIPAVPVGYSKKLRRMWTGPFSISEIGPNHTFRLRNVATQVDLPNLVNAQRLKNAFLDEHSEIRQNAVRVQQPIPRQQVDRHTSNADEARQTGQGPAVGQQPVREVEKVVNLASNNRGKWYLVKFKDSPKKEWRLQNSLQIPQELIDECLRYRTWQGTVRKSRKRRKRK